MLRTVATSALLLLASLSLRAQTLNDQVIDWFNNDQYEPILDVALLRLDELNDTSLIMAGLAAISTGQDSLALSYLDRSLQINPQSDHAFYVRSYMQSEAGNPAAALSDIEAALQFKPDDIDYLLQKADLLIALERNQEVMELLNRISGMAEAPKNVSLQIADAYFEAHQYQKALEGYQQAMKIFDARSDEYYKAEYNTAVCFYSMEQYAKAEEVLQSMLKKDKADYSSTSKLIQVLYAQKKYKKANKLKPVLYDAWHAGKLPESLEEDFCFDSFKWGDHKIYAYERYAEKGMLYYKHVFYVVDADGNIVSTIQTEHSSAVGSAGYKYVIGKDQGKRHYTYFSLLFKENFDYNELKKAVIAVLEGEVEPSSSSGRN